MVQQPAARLWKSERLLEGVREMRTAMFWSEPTRLFNATLKKMEPRLRHERYVGYIDVNCMVNSNGIYPLEFTS